MKYTNKDREKYIDYVAQLFKLAVSSRIHFEAITTALERSSFIRELEDGEYSRIYEQTSYDSFYEIFHLLNMSEDSPFIYNDAYWCGYVYMNIFYEFSKSFSYIFLYLPLEELMSLYSVYHEMDISQIYDYFRKQIEGESILSKLLKKKKISAVSLAEKTGISENTINYYKKSNKNIYKASFQNVYKIAKALDVPETLFLE